MSLQALRDLRRHGYAPGAVLVAVDLEPPADLESLVCISAGQSPRRVDWRPLIGLRAAFLFPDASWERGMAAYRAACEAGCTPVGIVAGGRVAALEVEFERPLARAWELLCRS